MSEYLHKNIETYNNYKHIILKPHEAVDSHDTNSI